jgi:hypothetical protein
MTLEKKEVDYIADWYNGEVSYNKPMTAILSIPQFKQYEIDYDKVKTLDDVINILRVMNIKYHYKPDMTPEELRPFLKESDEE